MNIEASYITGSRAYGYPKDDSDIDLVILVSSLDASLLWDLSDNKERLSFGKLNLICFKFDDDWSLNQYQIWKKVHNENLKLKPITREQAVQNFIDAGIKSYQQKTKDILAVELGLLEMIEA